MTQGSLKYALKKASIAAKLSKTISPHTLRHTFATHLIRRGADEREVQLLLGHSSLVSTSIYLNFSTKELKEIYTKFHPLENELYFDVAAKESYIFEWTKGL